jgi:hypothetical protein
VNLTGGSQLVVTEGERVVAGLRKLEVETTFGNYAKAAHAGMGRARARWPAVRSGPARARLGWVGRILRKNSFRIKNWIFEFTKALEICRRRFRRNFDMRIFLNSSRLLKDFRKI